MTRAHKRLTPRQWGWLIFGFAYLLSPVDLMPDFIPGLGNLDDAGVIAVVLKKVLTVEESS